MQVSLFKSYDLAAEARTMPYEDWQILYDALKCPVKDQLIIFLQNTNVWIHNNTKSFVLLFIFLSSWNNYNLQSFHIPSGSCTNTPSCESCVSANNFVKCHKSSGIIPGCFKFVPLMSDLWCWCSRSTFSFLNLCHSEKSTGCRILLESIKDVLETDLYLPCIRTVSWFEAIVVASIQGASLEDG